MGNDSWLFSGAVAIGALALGSVLWLLMRRQKQKLWLPILRVLDLNKKSLPQLRWVSPPWISILSYLLAAMAVVLCAFMPYRYVQKEEKLDLKRTHVLFDLSPSVSHAVDIEEYKIQSKSLLSTLIKDRKVSYSLSSQPGIHQLQEISDEVFGKEFNFHRAGLKLGSEVDELVKNSPEIEQLIVVSDRDQGSWEDFNWRYLDKKIEVLWYELGDSQKDRQNIFIDDVKRKDAPDKQGPLHWLVTLRRVGDLNSSKGALELSLMDRKLGEKDWFFAPGISTVELDFELKPEALNDLPFDDDTGILWRLKTAVSTDLAIDNEFRSFLNQKVKDLLLVAKPRGEMLLDDSVFHLKTSFEVLGYHIHRVDRWSELGSPSPFIVSEVSPDAPLSRFCPIYPRAGQKFSRQEIWLLPSADLQDYGDLCHCFAALMKEPESLPNRPSYCQDLQTREQWIGVMQSLGAKQIGGKMDSALGSLAMTYTNEKALLRITGFTTSLQPGEGRAISFGQLPILIKSLIRIFMSSQNMDTAKEWPRLADLTRDRGEDHANLSNVPYSESSLKLSLPDRMPPKLSMVSKHLVRSKGPSNLEKDATPWVKWSFFVLILALLFELVALLVRPFFVKKSWAFRWFFCLSFVVFWGEKGEAQVQLNTVGFSHIGRLQALKRDVSGRTSIELDEVPVQNSQFQKQVFQEPWIWVASPRSFDKLDREGWHDLVSWIERGGFLIVEQAADAKVLKQTIAEHIPQGQWKTIPPDHELMRSFHLLSSLPQCGNQVWEGFHFDQRVATLLIPGEFLSFLIDDKPSCYGKFSKEQALRIFINLQMVALATDYKKDQIHLPEILKRLR